MIAFLFIFTYIASGLVVNLLELCTSPLYLLNKRLYRIINAKLVYLQWCGESLHKNKTHTHYLHCKNIHVHEQWCHLR